MPAMRERLFHLKERGRSYYPITAPVVILVGVRAVH